MQNVGIFASPPKRSLRGNVALLEIAIDRRFGDAVVLHERFDEDALLALMLQFGDLRPR